jgi:hypothetical protein
VRVGAKPILAEVDETLCLAPGEIHRLRTSRTKAVLVVHFQGVAAELNTLLGEARAADIALLEDFSFCYRWTEIMKRQLWVCADAMVKHHGDFAYGATYKPILEREIRPHAGGAWEDADSPEALPG